MKRKRTDSLKIISHTILYFHICHLRLQIAKARRGGRRKGYHMTCTGKENNKKRYAGSVSACVSNLSTLIYSMLFVYKNKLTWLWLWLFQNLHNWACSQANIQFPVCANVWVLYSLQILPQVCEKHIQTGFSLWHVCFCSNTQSEINVTSCFSVTCT